jgi:hypothetical protein
MKALVTENLSSRTVGVVFLATPFRIDEQSLALPSFPWSTRSGDDAGVIRDLLAEYRSSPNAKTTQFRCFHESRGMQEVVGSCSCSHSEMQEFALIDVHRMDFVLHKALSS